MCVCVFVRMCLCVRWHIFMNSSIYKCRCISKKLTLHIPMQHEQRAQQCAIKCLTETHGTYSCMSMRVHICICAYEFKCASWCVSLFHACMRAFMYICIVFACMHLFKCLCIVVCISRATTARADLIVNNTHLCSPYMLTCKGSKTL